MGSLMLILGIMIIAGTAGASDLNEIELGTILINSVIGLVIAVSGYLTLEILGGMC